MSYLSLQHPSQPVYMPPRGSDKKPDTHQSIQTMQKQLALSALFVAFFLGVQAQNAYLDAWKIVRLKEKYASVWEDIRRENFPAGLSEQEKQLLRETQAFTESPFSAHSALRLVQAKPYNALMAEQAILEVPEGDAAGLGLAGTAVDLRSTLSVFNQPLDKSKVSAKVVEATTQLLAKRTRDELIAVFFELFRSKIQSNVYLHTFFPSTYKLLQLQGGYGSPALGANWSNVFETDLGGIPFQVETLIALKNPEFAKKTEGKLLSAALLSARLFKSRASALGVMGYLESRFSEAAGPGAEELRKGVAFSAMMANNLRGTDAAVPFLSPDSLEALGPEGRTYFWALLYQRHRGVFSTLGLVPSPDNIEQFHALAGSMSLLMSRFGPMAGNTPDWVAQSRTLLDVVEMGFKAPHMVNGGTLDEYYQSAFYQQKMSVPRNVLTLLELSRNRQYGLAVLGALEMLDTYLPMLKNDEKERAGLEKLAYYANFLSDIVTAGSSAEVTQIMERYVMPTGSYRIKRSVPFALDINAYPGLFLGAEFLKGSFPFRKDELSIVNGIATPVGIALSTGFVKEGKTSGHGLSLFIPVVDVGAAFSYRWSNKTGGLPEKFKLSQIFAPGAYLAWNIKRAPASILAGVQHTPALRSVRNGNNEAVQENTLRFGMTVSMDIPVFSLIR